MSSRDQFVVRARRRARRDLGRLARRLRLRPQPVQYGPRPKVRLERTNLGPAMDALVARMRRNQRMLRVNEDYDLVREHFDHYNFLLTAPGLHELPGTDPIRVFLHNGATAQSSPDINFSMRSYLERHPEYADGPERSPYLEWLKRGRATGEIADPAPGLERMAGVLDMEPRELVELLTQRRNDIQHRLRYGALGEMFAKAAQIEPLIAEAWGETTRPKLAPLTAPATVEQVATIKACQDAAGYRRARVVIVTGATGRGGAPVGHVVNALATRMPPEDIVVIHTDTPGARCSERFPAGVREVDFARYAAPSRASTRPQALVALLRSFHADAILNSGSEVMYEALRPYGRALAATERVFLLLTEDHQSTPGTSRGSVHTHFYRCFDLVDGVVVDSTAFKDRLVEQYVLDEGEQACVHVVPVPAVDRDEVPVAQPEAGGRPQVFWSGRWDQEHRLDLVLELARRMPEADFRLWGEPVGPLADVDVDAGVSSYRRESRPVEAAANVHLVTGFAGVRDLPLAEADVWLHSSSWPGVPTDLLEVAAAGVPIVAATGGGVAEIVGTEDAWLVEQPDVLESYQAALAQVLGDPAAARARARAFRARLLEERPESAYAEHLVGLVLPAGAEAAR